MSVLGRLYKRFILFYSHNQVLVQNISGTLLLKGGAAVLSLLLMPAYLSYFSDSRVLGSWFTILSLLNFMILFDFGVGNGLRNNIAASLISGRRKESRDLISAGYQLAFCVAALVMIVGFISVQVINWSDVFNIDASVLDPQVVENALYIILVTVGLQLILRNGISILYGMQKMVLANSAALLTSIILLLFLMSGGTGILERDLIRLAWVHLIATVLPLVALQVILFAKILPGLVPGLKFSSDSMRKVANLGLGFFAIQLSLLIVNSTDQILVTVLFGSEDVVEYQIYFRIFSMLPMVLQLFAQPFWSAVTAAQARGDQGWIRKATKALYAIALAGSALSVILVLVFPSVVRVWLGNNQIEVSYMAAFTFALLVSFEMIMYASTTIANGIGKLRIQMIWVPISAGVKIPFAFGLASMIDTWSAVVLAHALALVPIVLAQTWYLKRLGNEES